MKMHLFKNRIFSKNDSLMSLFGWNVNLFYFKCKTCRLSMFLNLGEIYLCSKLCS